MDRLFTGIVFPIVIVLLVAGEGYSQSKQIDSLKHALTTATNKEKIDIYIDLVSEYLSKDDLTTLQYADSAYSSALLVSDSLGMVKSLRCKGIALRRLNELDSSISVGEKALNIASRNGYTTEYVKVLNGLSLNYIYKANYDKALDFAFQSLQLREKDGDPEKISICLNNIGLIYYKIKNYNKSLEYYLRCLKIKREISDKWDLVILLSNISLAYTYSCNYRDGMSYAIQAFDECGDLCDDNSRAQMFFARGMVSFLSKTQTREAIHYFTESYNIAQKNHNDRFIVDNADKLAHLLANENQYKLAERYLREAESAIEGSAYHLELAVLYKRFFELYSIKGNWSAKSRYQGKYLHLKDSIFNRKLVENLSTIQSDYLERDRNARIVYQAEMLALRSKIIDRQIWLSILIGAIAFLLIVLVYILYRRNRQSKETNKLLNKRILERTEELNASCRVVQQKLHGRDLLLNRSISNLNNSITTAREICSLTKKADGHDYFMQMDIYMYALDEMLSDLLGREV
jgi:tetratricopeptide (TPR) repeat protein